MSPALSSAGAPGGDVDRGRPVFFLYPPRPLSDDVVPELFTNGYETYVVRDHVRIFPLLERLQGSLLYVNVDFRIPAFDWLLFLKSVVSEEATKSTLLGVVSGNRDADVLKRFRTEVVLPCGLIDANQGTAGMVEAMLSALSGVRARGRRHQVRLRLEGPVQSFNVLFAGTIYSGRILDISRAGMAVVFDHNTLFGPDTVFEDIQLRLLGSPVRIAGEVAGSRTAEDGSTVYVVMFGKDIGEDAIRKLSGFIQLTLQRRMDEMIAALL